jgi:excisionase family DNA binding protein
MSTTETREWLTLTEAAKRLGVTRTTLYRWRFDNLIPPRALRQVGPKWRVCAAWVKGGGK